MTAIAIPPAIASRKLTVVGGDINPLAIRAAKAKAETAAIGREAVEGILTALAELERATTLAASLDMVPVGIKELAVRWSKEAVENSQTVGSIISRVRP